MSCAESLASPEPQPSEDLAAIDDPIKKEEDAVVKTNGDSHAGKENHKHHKDGFLNKLRKKFSAKKKTSTEIPDKNSNVTVAIEPDDVRRRGFWRRSFGAGNKRQRASVMLVSTTVGAPGEDGDGLNLAIKTRSNSVGNLAMPPSEPAPTTAPEVKPKMVVKKLGPCPPRYWRLAAFGWYWGPITRSQASNKLFDQPDGSFLVRDSERDFNRFTLSFQAGGQTLHHRITTTPKNQFTFLEGDSFDSVPELIDSARARSREGVYCISRSAEKVGEQHEVRLLYPVTRFNQVRSLRYLCRFLVRHYTSYDCLENLSIPAQLHEFLQASDYYL